MLQHSELNVMKLTSKIQFGLIVGILLSKCCHGTEEWSYTGTHGPSTWSSSFSKCGGNQQSPINIKTKETLFKQLGTLTLNYDKNIAMKIVNNGHTVQLSVVDSGDNLTISGGSLPSGSVFRVAQLHFHWGGNNSLGSEHKFDGKSFPLEMYVIHYNGKYTDYSVARSKQDGLAVISVLFEVENKDNTNLNVVTQMLKNVSYVGTTMDINPISLKSLLPVEMSSFYCYHGSLTTPRCQENVEWIVFKNPANISGKQLESFRQIFQVNASAAVQQTKKPLLVNNFRPTQPLNQRSVWRNFDPPKLFCGRKEPLTFSCTKILRGEDVTFGVQLIKQCLLPTEVSVEVTVPSKDFRWSQSFFTQGKDDAVQIANLNYTVDVELHSHGDGSLHITVSLRDLLAQSSQSVDVISETFPVDQTCSVNCTSKDFKNCHRKIRSGDDVLDTGFAAKLGGDCDKTNCQVHIDLYRKENFSWMLSGVLVLSDGQRHTGSLKVTILHNQQSTHQVVVAGMKKGERQTFEAEIKKYKKEIYFKLYLVVSDAIKYEVFSKVFHPPADKSSSGGGSGTHIVIGVAVVLILVILIGAVTYLLYRKRHYFRGHQPALVDEMACDDSITDNRL